MPNSANNKDLKASPKRFFSLKKHSNSGQLSIFFSITLVILITIIAFIINIGLFVKAKINLQNATDASAWSGAATQARQLSVMSYMNWEMRNIYKEWMFKYYIIGNMNVAGVQNVGGNGDAVDFTMASRNRPNAKKDLYNFPSVCIHFSGTTNICKRYEIPGLPRFANTSLPGLDENRAKFIDSIVQKKAEDCARRTQLNFMAALNWIYGVKSESTNTISTAAPQIAADRPGAWPAAFELAIRIRNLEKIANTHGVSGKDFNQGICTNPANSKGIRCNIPITNVTANPMPHFERTSKAFFAGYRNLGNDADDEMKGSYTMTEITPKMVKDGNKYALNNLLITKEKDREKYYVDLKLITLNLINFYTAFVSMDSTEGSSKSEAGCFASKIGIPVPGYPFGFEKSQETVTYYAVKGEANFVGLFNPFSNNYTKLTSYAAAKPFGGRIGPKLFDTNSNTSLVQGRNDPPKSAAYLSGIFFNNTGYEPGRPIPLDNSFWINQPDQAVGGWLQEGSIRFGLPNLIFENVGDMGIHLGNEKIQIINPDDASTTPNFGLYNPDQLNALKENFPAFSGNSPIYANDINQAIRNVRAPTHYDAQNYLIPFPQAEWASIGVDSFGIASGPINSDTGAYNLNVYAPLYAPSGLYLYTQADEIRGVLQEYLSTQKGAIDSYTNSLKSVANNMRFKNTNAQGLYFKAAAVINDESRGNALSCASIAGTFSFYVLGEASGISDQTGCPDPFSENLITAWSTGRTVAGTSTMYMGEFKYRDVGNQVHPPLKFFTAYSPGPFSGATEGAKVTNKFLGGSELMRRNTYSTKFISLLSVSGKNGTTYNESTGFPIFSEGKKRSSAKDTKQKNFKNPMELRRAGADLQGIYH
jgi:hypothetical protein